MPSQESGDSSVLLVPLLIPALLAQKTAAWKSSQSNPLMNPRISTSWNRSERLRYATCCGLDSGVLVSEALDAFRIEPNGFVSHCVMTSWGDVYRLGFHPATCTCMNSSTFVFVSW